MPAVDSFGIVGSVIAEKYRVERVVDEGGFSVVYKAEHLIWREPVALKCFKVLAGAPPEQRDQLLDAFIQEGKLMTSLSSRSAAIVQARDIGKLTTPDGQWIPYIVMEWLEGKPLDLVLYDEHVRRLPPRNLIETLALLEPAAVAFELCHQRGIAHRDIKPGNLFVIGDPRGVTPFVKVLDFGIAKVMADHAAQATGAAHTGKEITAFTPNYGAPEQFSRTHGATGPWTDVFAMALIFVEVMRGGTPALDGQDFLQLGMSSRDPHRRPTPRQLGVEVPDAVERVFLRALAVSPADRFKTMGELWAALHQACFPDAPTWSLLSGGGGGAQRLSFASIGGPSGSGAYPGAPGYGPASQQPGMAAGYGPASQQPGMPAGYGPASQQPGMAAGYGPASQQPGMAAGYGPASQQPGMAPGYAPQQPVFQPGGGQGHGPAGAPPYPAPYTGATPSVVSPAAVAPGSRSRTGVFAGIAALAMIGGAVAAYMLAGSGRGSGASSGAAASGSASASAAPAASGSASAVAPKRLTECPAGMVIVPGGSFFMGSDEPTFKLWQPAHKVRLDTFCIDVYEVTAEAYKACSDKGECKRPAPTPSYPKLESQSDADYEKERTIMAELCNFGKAGREKHPINCVSWQMAADYCKVNDSRLPTEAEWEYAARGSDQRKYPWGDDPAREGHMNACGPECNAWEKAHGLKLTQLMYSKDDGYPGTAPVGSFPEGKTRFGSYDFVGNVWEWTADWYELYKADEVINPTGAPRGDRKAIRGGGYNGGVALWLDPAFRYHQVPEAAAPALGFRCARTL